MCTEGLGSGVKYSSGTYGTGVIGTCGMLYRFRRRPTGSAGLGSGTGTGSGAGSGTSTRAGRPDKSTSSCGTGPGSSGTTGVFLFRITLYGIYIGASTPGSITRSSGSSGSSGAGAGSGAGLGSGSGAAGSALGPASLTAGIFSRGINLKAAMLLSLPTACIM